MISFELGKEIEKDVFSCHERGTKKSLLAMEPQTFGFRVPMPYLYLQTRR